mmetsp:Transcript_20586/g.43115  ORF Transcript_20586/g.43115 Transcript_20586/m.43115 type:complete len:87 (-) Transcript_20586:148-408(-)|eukprot:CAMPEP_0118651000 /NCGR_PEP_ID=MMETSP0785-20121206/10550_1 /TAXON_ID=91992 /ORGANISM="Bolidomonas pacifica, Strain CCMP 1866" /LENGTH=86 /DNA_ID=CAMNT_0006543419 /DNA_START=68 /DNA_END=328 /DNA_ORIENTATION=+
MVIVTGFATPKQYNCTTVEELKLAVENEMFLPVTLLSNGVEVFGDLSSDAVVEASMTVDAGMRAKWRKKRMRRLRRKRRKMRQRAR